MSKSLYSVITLHYSCRLYYFFNRKKENYVFKMVMVTGHVLNLQVVIKYVDWFAPYNNGDIIF